MGKTRRMLGWARCPRPFCEGTVWVNDDGELDESDSGCGHEDYTDAELALIHSTIQPNEDDDDDDR